MNLAKKSDVYRYGTASNIAELQQLRGRNVAVLMYDTNIDIELIACERMWDLPYYASKVKVFPKSSDESKFMLLQVEIADPSNLPYELVDNEEVFVVHDEWDFSRSLSALSAGRKIESVFNTCSNADIDEDFLVMIGRELPRHMLGLILSRMTAFMED